MLTLRKLFIAVICFLLGPMAYAQQFEPKWDGEVVLLDIASDATAVMTEKSTPQVKTSSSLGRILFGIGNVRCKAVVKGPRAQTQMAPTDSVTLIVRCKDNATDPSTFIQIVKFEEKKKERRAELAKVNWVGDVSEGNAELVPFHGEKYGVSSYMLTFPCAEGEYGVSVSNPDGQDEKTPLFYCFGIHAPEPTPVQ